MTNPTTITVPAASTGKVARATFDLDLLFGDKKPTDASEAITFGTGGLFTATVNSDGTVDFEATGETGSDTATLTDDGETLEIELTVGDDTATGIESEGVAYVEKGTAV